jgi:hypothetical protein
MSSGRSSSNGSNSSEKRPSLDYPSPSQTHQQQQQHQQQHHHHHQHVSHGGSSSSASGYEPGERRPRAPRPSYSEEQKFFIMYSRIIRDNTWPEIEDRFERLFGTRTKGGLTSVYYRVRREWGLTEVLKSGPGSYAVDCAEVHKRATNFSREFLAQIGYFSSPP